MSEMTKHRTMNRRDFTIRGLGAFATLCSLGNRTVSGADEDSKKFRVAFASDTHMTGILDDGAPPKGHYHYAPQGNFSNMIQQVNASRAEALVITGDLARLEGFEADYKTLKQNLAPLKKETPAFMGFGNHDHRGNFKKVFGQSAPRYTKTDDRLIHVIEKNDARIIVLDSLLYTNQTSGYLGGLQREWLAEYLNTCDNRPTLLCFHHPPSDRVGNLLDTHALFALALSRRKIKALVFGHSHHYSFRQREGLHLINLPACGYSFDSREPVAWVEANLSAKEGVFTRRVIAGPSLDKKPETHVLKWRI